MIDTVPFDKENVKKYLDDCIRLWRKSKKNAASGEDELMAMCYIDAYQSVRISLFGETLGE